MTEKKDPNVPEKGGRYGLPGIPSYFDRVSQETIYRDKIHGEEAYLEKCKMVKPGDHMERMGVLKGFELIKYPSYVEVRKIYNPKEAEEKGKFIIGRGTRYAVPSGSTPLPSSTTSSTRGKSLDVRIREARAECNRTAPTYAYKYFSEKHMATLRGGPRDDKVRDLIEVEKRRRGLEDMSREPPPPPDFTKKENLKIERKESEAKFGEMGTQT